MGRLLLHRGALGLAGNFAVVLMLTACAVLI